MEAFRLTLVRCIISITRAVFFWIPGGDIAQGSALRAVHPVIMVSWVLLFFLYPSNRPLRIFICSMAIVTMMSQWYFKGCIITRAEQRLTGSKDTVVDPFLRFIRVPPTKESQLAITLGMSITITTIMLFSVFMDSYS